MRTWHLHKALQTALLNEVLMEVNLTHKNFIPKKAFSPNYGEEGEKKEMETNIFWGLLPNTRNFLHYPLNP